MPRYSRVMIWLEVALDVRRGICASRLEMHALDSQPDSVRYGDAPMGERLAFYGARRQPAHEVALEREEHDQGN